MAMSDKMRERFASRRSQEHFGENVITMKDFKKGTFRLLPADLIGFFAHKIVRYYFPETEKWVVSPLTFGGACPVDNEIKAYRKAAKKRGEKNEETNEGLREIVRTDVAYATPVIDLDDPWEDEDNHVLKAKVLLNKITPHEELHNFQEDMGEDISNVTEGRAFMLTKKGSGFDTEYKARPLDKSHIGDDLGIDHDTAVRAVSILALKFDIDAALEKVDYVALAQAYQNLAGEAMSADFKTQTLQTAASMMERPSAEERAAKLAELGAGEEKPARGGKAALQAGNKAAKTETKKPEAPAAETASKPAAGGLRRKTAAAETPAAAEPAPKFKEGDKVRYTGDDDKLEGVVKEYNADGTVVVVDDASGDLADIPEELLALTEPPAPAAKTGGLRRTVGAKAPAVAAADPDAGGEETDPDADPEPKAPKTAAAGGASAKLRGLLKKN